MAGLAATRLFSAGGAGGIVLTYWALRKAGMPRKETAARMVAFLVLLYAVYMLTLVINGILLRTGVFSGPAPAGLTIVPAAIAGGVIVDLPADRAGPGRPRAALLARLAGELLGPDGCAAWRPCRRPLAVGIREALAFVREPSRGGLAIARRDRLLGGEHRHPLGRVQRLRRRGPARGRRPGLLRRHVRQPAPAAGRGRRRRRRA